MSRWAWQCPKWYPGSSTTLGHLTFCFYRLGNHFLMLLVCSLATVLPQQIRVIMKVMKFIIILVGSLTADDRWYLVQRVFWGTSKTMVCADASDTRTFNFVDEGRKNFKQWIPNYWHLNWKHASELREAVRQVGLIVYKSYVEACLRTPSSSDENEIFEEEVSPISTITTFANYIVA